MFFRGWHPEGAIRYLPVVDEIKKLDHNLGSPASILEIGPGEWGIVPYVGRGVDGVDPHIKKTRTDNLHLLEGSATSLSGKDKSYDVVIAIDALEHMSHNMRVQAVEEMIRVARHLVVIAVPSGPHARRHDVRMDLLYQFWHKVHEPMILEHARFRLPDPSDLMQMIVDRAKKHHRHITIREEKNLNIAIRQFLIQWWILPWRWSYYFYLKGLLPVVLFRRFLNFGACYRQIFFITLQN